METLTTKEALGFQPNGRSANWFVRVGQGEKSIVVAGCQIHYAIQLKEKPVIKTGGFWRESDRQNVAHNMIYLAEEEIV